MQLTGIDFAIVAYTLGIYAAIVISPGSNFALVSRLAFQGRRYACGGAIVGLATAATFYAVLAMIGLAALLNEIGWLARSVQVAGGLYLIYLGVSAWWSAKQAVDAAAESDQTDRGTFLTGLRLGVIVNLSNPKGISFFVGLYAVAVPPDATWATRFSILTGGAALEFLWYGMVAALLSRGPFRTFYSASAKWIERAIGSALIFFGTRLVMDK